MSVSNYHSDMPRGLSIAEYANDVKVSAKRNLDTGVLYSLSFKVDNDGTRPKWVKDMFSEITNLRDFNNLFEDITESEPAPGREPKLTYMVKLAVQMQKPGTELQPVPSSMTKTKIDAEANQLGWEVTNGRYDLDKKALAPIFFKVKEVLESNDLVQKRVTLREAKALVASKDRSSTAEKISRLRFELDEMHSVEDLKDRLANVDDSVIGREKVLSDIYRELRQRGFKKRNESNVREQINKSSYTANNDGIILDKGVHGILKANGAAQNETETVPKTRHLQAEPVRLIRPIERNGNTRDADSANQTNSKEITMRNDFIERGPDLSRCSLASEYFKPTEDSEWNFNPVTDMANSTMKSTASRSRHNQTNGSLPSRFFKACSDDEWCMDTDLSVSRRPQSRDESFKFYEEFLEPDPAIEAALVDLTPEDFQKYKDYESKLRQVDEVEFRDIVGSALSRGEKDPTIKHGNFMAATKGFTDEQLERFFANLRTERAMVEAKQRVVVEKKKEKNPKPSYWDTIGEIRRAMTPEEIEKKKRDEEDYYRREHEYLTNLDDREKQELEKKQALASPAAEEPNRKKRRSTSGLTYKEIQEMKTEEERLEESNQRRNTVKNLAERFQRIQDESRRSSPIYRKKPAATQKPLSTPAETSIWENLNKSLKSIRERNEKARPSRNRQPSTSENEQSTSSDESNDDPFENCVPYKPSEDMPFAEYNKETLKVPQNRKYSRTSTPKHRGIVSPTAPDISEVEGSQSSDDSLPDLSRHDEYSTYWDL